MARHAHIGTRCVILGVLGCLALGGCKSGISDKDIRYVTIGDVRTLMERQKASPDDSVVLLLDPRPPRKFAEGHLPGAENLQTPAISRNGRIDPKISATERVIVYGDDQGSPAAKAMTKRLLEIGYTRVRMFAGGMQAWREAGYEVVTETDELAVP